MESVKEFPLAWLLGIFLSNLHNTSLFIFYSIFEFFLSKTLGLKRVRGFRRTEFCSLMKKSSPIQN